MKYQYFYQTSKNENKDGFVRAKNRAEAYALLRKQGIRPYRLLGDDPVNWQPWAVGAAFAVLLAAFFALFFFWYEGPASAKTSVRRQQLTGDDAVLSKGIETGWSDYLPTCLDRYLAAYAQPGWIALPPDFAPEQIAKFKDDLAVELVTDDSDPEMVVLLKKILTSMRQELKGYLKKGGDIADYLKLLDERQDREISVRKQAREAVEAAPEEMKARVLMNQNLFLREMGLAELEF